MIKAFISHSHRDKEYAHELVNCIGRDSCILDSFDFSPAYKTIDSIYNAIESSTLFVLLISCWSLESDWVKYEIKEAKDHLGKDKLDRFLPYLIDPSISIEDIPEWFTKTCSFNIRYFRSPLMLKKDIEEKLRKNRWQRNPALARRESTFIGRNSEIDIFQGKIYSERGRTLRAHITSGRPGIGKDYFALQCLEQLGKKPGFEPYRISMESKDTIEYFILQLNLITRFYSDEEMKSGLAGSIEDKVNMAVSMLNDIYQLNDIVFVEDNMSCVRPNLKAAQWVLDIIESPSLDSHLGLFIQSTLSPHSYFEFEHPKISHIVLHPLSNSDRSKLFYMFLQSYDLELEREDVRFFVDRLLYSPNQLLMAVDTIKRVGLQRAKQEIQRLVEIGDHRIRPVLDLFKEKERRNFVLLLAKYEFLSFDLLEKIYQDQYDEILDIISDGLVYGVLETFGPSEEYVKVDHYLSDYIRRNKLQPDKDLVIHATEILESEIALNESISDDVSLFLYDVKQQILTGNTNSDSYLIPSIVIKAIIDLYYRRRWKDVIKICDKVLDDCNNYYPDVRREALYWQCSAFCRPPQDSERFYNSISGISGSDNIFLRGFFLRNARKYSQAEEKYREVLKLEPNMRRAKRELVSVLLAQRKYQEALELACENYNQDKDNTYHIYAYFRCLIKKTILGQNDIEILQQLMREVRNNFSSKRDELLAAMDIEYSSIVKKLPPMDMLKLINTMIELYPDSVNVKRASDEYKYRQGLINTISSWEEEDLLS